MTSPVTVRERDLRALAAMVSEDRPDLPDSEGVPPSLLADLMGQIRCDVLALEGCDPGRQMRWFSQAIPSLSDAPGYEGMDQVFWENYPDYPVCRYAARTGSVVKITDFYSARQWHSTAIYASIDRRQGFEHGLVVCLPIALPPTAGPGRYVALEFIRGPGPDFSERDRAVLTLLAPHLGQAYLDAERRRHPAPRLTPRQGELLRLVAAGHTNAQIGRRLGVTGKTVGKHLENIYARLHVSSRTAAVTRAFGDQAAR